MDQRLAQIHSAMATLTAGDLARMPDEISQLVLDLMRALDEYTSDVDVELRGG